jgi:hypothetical protein
MTYQETEFDYFVSGIQLDVLFTKEIEKGFFMLCITYCGVDVTKLTKALNPVEFDAIIKKGNSYE